MGKVRAVCVSDVRGVQKKNVERAWFATEPVSYTHLRAHET